MKQKLSILMLLALTLGAVLTGCNKPADTAPAPTPPPASTNTP